MSDVGFWILAVGAVVTGIGVFRVDSMARATFLLLASFLFAAGELLLLGLGYLGMVIVLMMTMEMVVMAVFMVMYMMNPAGLMPMTMVHNQRAAAVIAVVTFAALVAGILLTPWPERRGARPMDPTMQVGEAIMGPQMLLMIVIGVAILATMIASVVLATDRGRYDRYGDRLERRRPDDPIPGGRR
ncbi:NADH-quinone oxidoreductase subunit J [Actinomadura sp. 6N118]|uniref:NADH-quinone oxidoreductase subunit J n=1 Tax=Actinomadura sp. 6N118 TaxID=3375151 RepID=UPI0037B757E6